MSIVSFQQHLELRRSDNQTVAPAKNQQLELAAEQFEAMFLQQILKQMRKASDVLGADNPMRSRELDTMRDLYDEVLAESLSSQRQVGIADMLVEQLGSQAEGLDLAQAQELARSAPIPARSSQAEPIRSTWQRGLDQLGNLWEQGSEAFSRLVDGVIHQESGGNVAAVSPKGASGLMQLMPETAREVASELGLPFDQARLLTDGAYNKQLGSAYLSKMLDRYDGNQVLALSAYNAGPGRVDEWLERFGDPRTGDISQGDWVALIPYQETRDYTRNILGRLEAKAQAGLNVSTDSVALLESSRRVPDSSADHQSRSAAFATPIRLETRP